MLFAIVEVYQRFTGPELKQALVSAVSLKDAASKWRETAKDKAVIRAFCTQNPIGNCAYNEPYSAAMTAEEFLGWIKEYTRYPAEGPATPPLFTEISTGKVIE